jgi:Kef-type K+ transport system membrane component KefB
VTPSPLLGVGISFAFPFASETLIFGTLLLLLFLVPQLSRRLRVPEVIGLIVAGMLVGPAGIGMLLREGAVKLLGNVGLLYIMFHAGLEIDLNGFARQRSRALVFGALTFLMPMLLGTAVAHWVLGFNWMASVLMASMFASHTLLSYPIISRLGLSQHPAVTTALGGTIITDTLALLVLAVIAAMTQGEVGAGFWVRLGLAITIYVAAVSFLVPRVSRWVFRLFDADGENQYLYVLAVVFGCAVLAEVAGLEGIIGAFFAGLALNRLIPHRSTLMNRIEFVGSTLFQPLFLISVGMVVDLRSMLGSLKVWAIGLVMMVTVTSTKYAAAWLTARIYGHDRHEMQIIFGLSLAQAAATLAVVFVGRELELFDDAVLNGTILMILGTCIISPLVTERAGRKVAQAQEEVVTQGKEEAPARILIPLANPATTESLMSLAVLLHNPKSTEPLYPLTVAAEGDDVEERVAQGERNLSRAVAFAVAAGRPVVPVTRVDGDIPRGIRRALVELRIRTVIVGWNGESTTRQTVFGSVLDRLLADSTQTLIVYRHARPPVEHRRVLVAIPPFATRVPGFDALLRDIHTLCTQLGASLHLLTPIDRQSAVKARLGALQPPIEARFLELSTWDGLMPSLVQQAQPTDLLVAVAAREGSLAWSADQDRLPRQLARRFPDSSFCVAYPSVDQHHADVHTVASQQTALRQLAAGSPSPLPLQSLRGREAVAELVGAVLAGVEVDPAARRALELAALQSATRLQSGVVLLEVHADLPLPSRLQVGLSDEGMAFERIAEPVVRVWLLVTGSALSADQHLFRLTGLLQRLRRAPADALRDAITSEAIRALLEAEAPRAEP